MCDLKLDRDDNNVLVKLTQKNVEMVEAMIKENSSYALTLNDGEVFRPESKFLEYLKKFVKSADDEIVLIDKKNAEAFCGSTKWWVKQLEKCKVEETEYFKILIAGLIHNIDRTNSTHLNARTKDEETGETQGRKQIYKKITENINNIEVLKSKLEDEKKPLIKIIAEKDKKTGKYNLSFATKFCHYLSWYLYENKDNENSEYQNMYSIYDSVIAETLPLYIEKYEIKKEIGIFIEEYYREDIEKIIKKYKIKENIKNITRINDKKALKTTYNIDEENINDIINKYNNGQKYIKNFLTEPPFKNDVNPEAIHRFYNTYISIIDKIIEVGREKEKEQKKITRRQFDHLVWYSNKGKTSTESEKFFNTYLEDFKRKLTNKQ